MAEILHFPNIKKPKEETPATANFPMTLDRETFFELVKLADKNNMNLAEYLKVMCEVAVADRATFIKDNQGQTQRVEAGP